MIFFLLLAIVESLKVVTVSNQINNFNLKILLKSAKNFNDTIEVLNPYPD